MPLGLSFPVPTTADPAEEVGPGPDTPHVRWVVLGWRGAGGGDPSSVSGKRRAPLCSSVLNREAGGTLPHWQIAVRGGGARKGQSFAVSPEGGLSSGVVPSPRRFSPVNSFNLHSSPRSGNRCPDDRQCLDTPGTEGPQGVQLTPYPLLFLANSLLSQLRGP